MGTDTAILFSEVNKRFKYSSDEARSIIDAIIASVGRKPHRREQILWAVRDASFSVASGESLALVGRNGSGKSTILKLAAGIFRPTSGRIEVRGRLSALIELGAGFHPDLTGRENIQLNASILGLTNAEIEGIYQQIVDFSELGEYINMPVKHYSSGMYMRLGFSVAVHIGPDVLLIDEILAVGDQSFQDKCIERLYELRQSGTTIVFVSHDPEAVISLCERALWIENGRVIEDGSSKRIVGDYQASQGAKIDGRPVSAGPVTRDVELAGLRLYNAAGHEQDVYESGEGIVVELDYLAHRTVANAEFDLSIQHEDGTYVGGPAGRLNEPGLTVREGPGTLRCRMESMPLLPAAYHISATVYDGDGQTVFDRRERAQSFRIIAEKTDRRAGLLRIPATWETVARPTNEQGNTPEKRRTESDGAAAEGISPRANS